MGKLRRKKFRKRQERSNEQGADENIKMNKNYNSNNNNNNSNSNNNNSNNNNNNSEYDGMDFDINSEDFEEDIFQLCASCEEALDIWTTLTKEEKLDVLDVDADELTLALKKSSLPLDDQSISKLVRKIFSTKQIMMGCRAQFLLGISSSGVIPSFHYDPITVALIQIMENHLFLIYRRREVQIRWFGVVSFWILLISGWSLIYGLITMAGVSYLFSDLGFGKSKYVYKLKDAMLIPFESENSDRMGDKVHAFLCFLLVYTMGYWIHGFPVLVIVSSVPIILIEIETCTDHNDANALGKIRKIVQWINVIILLYLSWYSWTTFICMSILVASKLLLLVLGLALSVFTFILNLYSAISVRFFSISNRSWITWILHIILTMAIFYYRDYFNWTIFLLLVNVSILFVPPALILIISKIINISYIYMSDNKMGPIKFKHTIVFGICLVLAAGIKLVSVVRSRCCAPRGVQN